MGFFKEERTPRVLGKVKENNWKSQVPGECPELEVYITYLLKMIVGGFQKMPSLEIFNVVRSFAFLVVSHFLFKTLFFLEAFSFSDEGLLSLCVSSFFHL